MKKKPLSEMMLTFLLLSMATFTFNIQLGRAESTGTDLSETSSPDVLWSEQVGGELVWVVKPIDDVDGDGKQDVIAGTIYNFEVWCLTGNAGSSIWSHTTEGWTLAIAIIDDVEGDERQDVVVGVGYPDPSVQCLSGSTGNSIWSYSMLSPVSPGSDRVIERGVDILDDVDGDGKKDVIVGVNCGGYKRSKVIVLDGRTGSLLWSRTFDARMASVLNIGDIDGDGKQDVAALVSGLSPDNYGIFFLNGEDGTVHSLYEASGYAGFADVIDDIDGDSKMDIVLAVNQTGVSCVSGGTANLLWTYSVDIIESINPVMTLKSIGDVNDNGRRDIVVGTSDSRVLAISDLGVLVWAYNAAGRVYIEDVGFVEDIDSDGKPDIVVGTRNSSVDESKALCISGGSAGVGSLVWSYDVSDGITTVSGVEDVNNDGRQDVIIGTRERDGKIHMISGASVDAGTLIWSHTSGSMAWRLVPIHDVNNDGKQDLIVYSFEGMTRCLCGSSGEVLWTIESDAMPFVVEDTNNDRIQDIIIHDACYSGYNGALIWSSSAHMVGGLISNVGDIDDDGVTDILAPVASTGYHFPPILVNSFNVSCISGATGVPIWHYATNATITPPYLPYLHTPTVADVNSDKTCDVLVTSVWTPSLFSDEYHYEVQCVDGNSRGAGELLWKYEVSSEINGLLTVDDVDDDDAQDVIVATTGGFLYCISGKGLLIWSSPSESVPLTQISDINEDGKPDVVAIDASNRTLCFSGGDGTLLWSYTAISRIAGHVWYGLYTTYTLHDISGDGKHEVLIRTSYPDDTLYCISGRDGILLWSAKLGRGIRFFDPVDDVNNDGVMDILVGATNRTGYCVSGKEGSIVWRFLGKSYVTCMWQADDFDGDGRQDFFVASGEIYCLSYHPFGRARVYVDPRIVMANIGEDFSIDIDIADVTDLFAWQFFLSWNTTVLEFVSITEGDILATQPEGTFFVADTNQTAHPGSLGAVATTLGEYTGVDGSGTLASIALQVKEYGETIFHLYDTILVDSQWLPGQPGPENQIPHVSIDGYFSNVQLAQPAAIDIDPDTLNLKSRGRWVTCYIELPEGCDVNDVLVGTVMLDDTIPAAWGEVQDSVLMVKFDRASVISHIYSVLEIEFGDVALTVSGQLSDGTVFEGTDIIRVIFAGDVNRDGLVDIIDLAMIGKRYGRTTEKPLYPEKVDLNSDEVIDIVDLAIAAVNYGATTPE